MRREEALSILKSILADLQRGAKDTDSISCCSEYGFITYGKAKDCIKALEQEPRKGHWIKHNTPSNTYYYDCSLCGCAAPCTETADAYLWKLSNFCPDCGADMRGEEDDNT